MIPAASFEAIFAQLKAVTGITWIRGNQRGQKPAYPFARYVTTSVPMESPYQAKETQTTDGADSGQILKTMAVKFRESVGLGFFHVNTNAGRDAAIAAAKKAFFWFGSDVGRDFCRTYDLTPRILSPSIEDRATYVDTDWEEFVGFDVRFDGAAEQTDGVDYIETAEITTQVEGATENTATITLGG